MGAATGWTVPGFALGTGTRFRVSAGAIARQHTSFTCPMGLALDARFRAGSLRPDDPSARPRFDRSASLIFAVQRAVGALAAGTDPRDIVDGERDLTHSQRRYLRHALDVLPDLIPEASRAAGAPYRPAESIAGRVPLGTLHGTVTVFAMHLTGPGAAGAVHEAVRIRLSGLREPTAEDAVWVAVAAVALATDDAVGEDARIRVSEFSALDGQLRCSFDGSRSDAIDALRRHGTVLWEALGGSVFRPGSACVGCAFLSACPAVESRSGLLGVPKGVVRRRVSAADLASYSRCPTVFRVRDDHLPARYSDIADLDFGGPQRRGLAVHAWLAWAHARQPARACTPEDLPSPGSATAIAAAAEAGLDPDDCALAYPYLAQHPAHCLVGHPELGGWAPERPVVSYDPHADAVVISTPDLVAAAADSGEPVWRETKTAATVPPDLFAAMRRYPDLALNLVLLADRADQTGLRGDAELEVLTPGGGTVLAASTDQTDIVALARDLVTRIAGSLVTDTVFDRDPGPGCPTCPAHGWCDPPEDRVHFGGVPVPPGGDPTGDEAADDAPF